MKIGSSKIPRCAGVICTTESDLQENSDKITPQRDERGGRNLVIMALKVDQCCCGCSLKTGTILIAVYYVVVSLCVLLFTILCLYWLNHDVDSMTQLLNSTESVITGRGNSSVSHFSENIAGVTAVLTFVMTRSILSIVLSIMLLVGTLKEKLRLIYLWIITHVIYLAVTVVALLTNMFMSVLRPDQRMGSVGFSLLNIVLTFYFLVVVNSYHQQLKDRLNTTTPQAPPIVVYIDNQAPPPPYSELYPSFPQQK